MPKHKVSKNLYLCEYSKKLFWLIVAYEIRLYHNLLQIFGFESLRVFRLRFPTFGSPPVLRPSGALLGLPPWAWLRRRRSEGALPLLPRRTFGPEGRSSSRNKGQSKYAFVQRRMRRPFCACRGKRAFSPSALCLPLALYPTGRQERQGIRPSFTPKGARGVPSLLNEDLSSASPTGGTLRRASPKAMRNEERNIASRCRSTQNS